LHRRLVRLSAAGDERGGHPEDDHRLPRHQRRDTRTGTGQAGVRRRSPV
jgi:hypothetical protein